jgi:hypothetical protein
LSRAVSPETTVFFVNELRELSELKNDFTQANEGKANGDFFATPKTPHWVVIKKTSYLNH